VILHSAKSGCFEGGYIGEGLHIIRGIHGVTPDPLSVFWKGNEPLVPSEATLVVFEKDGVAASEPVGNGARAEEGNTGYSQAAAIAITAVLFFALGVVAGRVVLAKNPPENARQQQGFSLLALVVILAMLALGGGYVVYRSYQQSTTNDRQQAAEGASVPEDWKTYRNQQHGFEFQYPSTVGIDIRGDSMESGAALTFPVTNPAVSGKEADFYSFSESSRCQRTRPKVRMVSQSTIMIGGKEFVHESFVDDKSSQRNNIDRFHAMFNGKCIDIKFVIFWSTPNPSEDDRMRETAVFDRILSTFRFTK
jgi:hypothetical protein